MTREKDARIRFLNELRENGNFYLREVDETRDKLLAYWQAHDDPGWNRYRLQKYFWPLLIGLVLSGSLVQEWMQDANVMGVFPVLLDHGLDILVLLGAINLFHFVWRTDRRLRTKEAFLAYEDLYLYHFEDTRRWYFLKLFAFLAGLFYTVFGGLENVFLVVLFGVGLCLAAFRHGHAEGMVMIGLYSLEMGRIQ